MKPLLLIKKGSRFYAKMFGCIQSSRVALHTGLPKNTIDDELIDDFVQTLQFWSKEIEHNNELDQKYYYVPNSRGDIVCLCHKSIKDKNLMKRIFLSCLTPGKSNNKEVMRYYHWCRSNL